MAFDIVIHIILIGVFEVALLTWMIVYSIKNRKIFSKKNFRYMVLLFLIAFLAYSTGYRYKNGSLDFPLGFFECIDGSMKALSFRADRAIVGNLVNDSKIFSIELSICTIFGGFTSLFTIFSFFRNFIVNKLLLLTKLSKTDIDVVIGNTTKSVKYCAKNPKDCILWIDSNNEELTDKDKEKFYNDRIAYIYKPLINHKAYNGDELYSIVKLINQHKHTYFIYFDNEAYSNKSILDLLRMLCDIKNEELDIDDCIKVINPTNNIKDYKDYDYVIFDSSISQYDTIDKQQAKIDLLKNSKVHYEFIDIKNSKEFNMKSHNIARFIEKLFKKDTVIAVEPLTKDYMNDCKLYIKKAYLAKKHVVKFFIESQSKYTGFMNEQLAKIVAKNSNNRKYSITASCFYLYDLLARNFSIEKNFADYIPDDFYDDNLRTLVKKDKDINVVMMGFGRTNEAMFKSLIINNQFIQKGNEETYAPKLVNYFIYERDEQMLHNSLITKIYDHQNKASEDKGLDDYYNLCTLKILSKDVCGEDFYKGIKELSNDENAFTFVFVNCETGVNNSAFAANIGRLFPLNRGRIFYVISNHNYLLDIDDNDNLEGFGFKEELLTHDKINNQDLYELAGASYVRYIKLKNDDYIPVDDLSSFAQMSNVYSNMNIKFKLKLLGLKLVDVDPKNIEEVKESLLNYYEIYDPRIYDVLKDIKDYDLQYIKNEIDNAYSNKHSIFGKLYSYESYFAKSIRSSLSFQEHLRWNAYELVNGYQQMSFDKITYDINNKKGIHKDEVLKEQACITTYKFLDNIAEKEVEEARKKGNQEVTKYDLDLYKYDYMTMDMLPFSLLVVAHPKKIVKIEKEVEK